MSRGFWRDANAETPGRLARRIGNCIVRNALEEECRAQKALYLLKVKDHQIACLEKRVAELEDAAVSLHAMSLQESFASLSPKGKNSRPLICQDFLDKNDVRETAVPSLKLLSTTDSDKDIFWTPIVKHVHRNGNHAERACEHYSDSSLRSRSVIYEDTPFTPKRVENQRLPQEKIPSQSPRGNCENVGENERNNALVQGKDVQTTSPTTKPENSLSAGNGRKLRMILRARRRRPNVPRSRVKVARRRSFETKVKRQADISETEAATGMERGSERAPKKVEEKTKDGVVMALAQEAQVIADGSSAQSVSGSGNSDAKKSSSTQTSDALRKECSTMTNIDEDPAPQWLIEEALNRGNEVRQEERMKEMEIKEAEYEAIIAELERKLEDAKDELRDTLRQKDIAKEKYKRALETVKEEAYRENEMLQEKIVKICSSVMERFGPYALNDTRSVYQVKTYKRLKNYGKLSVKLRKKLRNAINAKKKVKFELVESRRVLNETSEKYAAANKCLTRLKQEFEITETNLNDLIAENGCLRKKIDETREWIERKVGKEQHDGNNAIRFKVMEKSREIAKLKKKADEDFATIAELRGRLLRSESANANKGFLLNSYKSQLADITKEKERLNAKMKISDAEINSLRNGNSQLKAKVTLLNSEKEKLALECEKSDSDTKEKMDSVSNKTYEESLKATRQEYEQKLKAMKSKLSRSESGKSEYYSAIEKFLAKVHERRGRETGKYFSGDETSEREAHEAACNILNMTPEQLCGFMSGKPSDTINFWLADLNRITSKTNFADNLAKFLLKKTTAVFET